MIIDGLDSRQFHPHQLREAFRFVGQDAELFSGTVRDNLMLGAAQADDQPADRCRGPLGRRHLPVARRRRIRLAGRRARFPPVRRPTLAASPCAGAGEPGKLLFLDEPTGAMDTQTELYFIEHLKTALAPDQTLVVATHRHNMLSILDRLIVIDGGRSSPMGHATRSSVTSAVGRVEKRRRRTR